MHFGSGGSRLEVAGSKKGIYSKLCSGSNFIILKDLTAVVQRTISEII